ncbi:hypothetical protein EJ08DRAFT_697129 [Tothia fuscella]|uniref:Peptidase M12A domain-containing protein n=1 Tax=Tothia fuscella TaxID=1048955 RepID=A0A9P4NSJ3_9PEZI|nr:hypothetical protein EJ08DRAFT_697129 [Tothia fuscella]
MQSLAWSPHDLVLQSRKGIRVYHNYTPFIDEAGHHQQRYTFSRSLSVKPRSIISKRGFSVNTFQIPFAWVLDYCINRKARADEFGQKRYFSWRWKAAVEGCPAIIDICYEDELAMNKMVNKEGKNILEEAVNAWKEGLGDRSGVYFRLLPKARGICSNEQPRDAVRVRYDPFRSDGAPAVAYVGFQPALLTHTLELTNNLFDSWALLFLIHEFGHMLGLEHEHQRYDTAKHIKLNCEKIPGYNQALEQYKKEMVKWPGMDREEQGTEETFRRYVCIDYNNAMANNLVLSNFIMNLAGKVCGVQPLGFLSTEPTMAGYGKGILLGNWMILRTTARSMKILEISISSRSCFILINLTWNDNTRPSKGDIQSVKNLYPDVEFLALDEAGNLPPPPPRPNLPILPPPSIPKDPKKPPQPPPRPEAPPGLPTRPGISSKERPVVPSKPASLAASLTTLNTQPATTSKEKPTVPSKPASLLGTTQTPATSREPPVVPSKPASLRQTGV